MIARGRSPLWTALLAGAVVATIGAVHVVFELRQRTYPLDLDGWGHLVGRLQAEHAWGELWREPSLWKGPVIPFVIGLVYYLVPNPLSPIVLNVFAAAGTAVLLVLGLGRLGASPRMVAGAVTVWALYPPHRFVPAYYYAEPIVAWLTAAVVVAVGMSAVRMQARWALIAGALAGLLLLSRPPFLGLVLVSAVFLHLHTRRRVRGIAAAFLLSVLVVWAPWPIRNAVAERAFVPFTTEGGKIAFQGFWVDGDDAIMDDLRRMPAYQALELAGGRLPPIEEYKYWQKLAFEELRRDPFGQVRLTVKKALRFWMYVPAGHWLPTWKTAVFACAMLPLAGVALWRRRDQFIVQLAALPVVGLWSVHLVLHTELRYNYPVLPYALVLAAMGAATFTGRGSARSAVSRAMMRWRAIERPM
jgi:hypothetical protein